MQVFKYVSLGKTVPQYLIGLTQQKILHNLMFDGHTNSS